MVLTFLRALNSLCIVVAIVSSQMSVESIAYPQCIFPPSALPCAGLHLWLWQVLEGQGMGFCCVDDGLQPWPVCAQVREACPSLCPLTPGLLTGVPRSVSDTGSQPWGHLCALAPVPLQQRLSGRGGSARADLCPSRAADLRGERRKVPLPIPRSHGS